MLNRFSILTLSTLASSLLLASASAIADPAQATATPIAGYHAHAKHSYKGAYKDAVVPCHHPLLLNDGFYVGAQGGYDSYRTRVSSNASFPAAGFELPSGSIGANPVVSSNGFVGGLFAGYGELWSDFYYTGIEVFVNGSTALQSQYITSTIPIADGNSVEFSTQVTTDLSWGISFIPGLKFTDSTLLYGRVGYSQAKIRGQSAEIVNGAGLAVGTAMFGYNRKQFVGGLSYGAGIETAIFRQVSVRSEYSHYGYNTFSDQSGTNYGASNNQLMVSLVYHFA